jgi:hypothetical protein
MHQQCWLENLFVENLLEDLGVNGSIILKCPLKEQGAKV